MPLGKNNTDLNNGGVNYRKGFAISIPHSYGNPIPPTNAWNNSNPIPTQGTEQNKITWTPSPSHFGNVNP